ncbi:MAG TPA: LLM class F420-dependent oxidoreductase [Aquihabitans sp.]|jgi:alkanesulfonate monooxygenase|nr:LLM class F420-dependent oxidoreductase [Aquihabitans sp.]
MELRIFTEPQQGATYDDLLAVALEAEALGFGAFFRSDHFLHMGGEPGPGPTDAWITLAGLARDTSTIRLGTLVTSATFRLPGPLAVTVATVDAMSGGRIELGLGAGWFEAEHTAFGIPFPATGERFDRLEEQLEIVTGLWATEQVGSFAHDGAHYQVAGGTGLPKPVQSPRPPIVIGGHGPKRTPALAARFADEFNVPFSDVGATAAQFDRVRAAVEAAGRDAGSMAYSAAQVLCIGADEAEVTRRAAAIGREPAELRENGAAGTPAEVVDKLGRYAELGATRAYLQVLDLTDLDHLRLVAEEVAPALR